MKSILAAMLCLLAMPTLALTPKPVGKDGRICEVAYDPNEVIAVTVGIGDAVTIQLAGKDDHFKHVAASFNSQELISAALPEEDSPFWVVKLKDAKAPVAPVSMQFAHGTDPQQQLTLELTPIDPLVLPRAQIASAAGVSVTEDRATPCYVVRITFPQREAEERAAKTKAQWAAAAARKAEIELHKAAHQFECRKDNIYEAMGDHALDPVTICDDGVTTRIQFGPTVPTIFGVDADSKDVATLGYTVEDNSVVKLHSVPAPLKGRDGQDLPVVRLRVNDQVLCIFNRNYQPAPTGTGTTSADFRREVRTK
jgi:type IV secretory pathway VirB9-like protein